MHHDPEKPLSLAVDASPVVVGAVISHYTLEGELPVAFGSRSVTSAEKNYSLIEMEGLAIVFGLQNFHQYLYGMHFTLITDNKPVSLVLGLKKSIPAIAAAHIQRWAVQLVAYSYDLKCCPSNQSRNADCRSCHHIDRCAGLPVTAKAISKETLRDPVLAQIKSWATDGRQDKNGPRNTSSIIQEEIS